MRHTVCACCGTSAELEQDHRLPRARGGSSDPDNLQPLCRRCNLSKGDGDGCTINHTLDVMLMNREPFQGDTPSSDGHDTRAKRSGERAIKGPNPQVNWRVEKAIKEEIEETAKRRGMSAGEVIKELWRSQHAEILQVLQEILIAVKAPPSDDRPSGPPVPVGTRTLPPYSNPQEWELWEAFKAQQRQPVDPPLPAPAAPKRWWQRLLGQ